MTFASSIILGWSDVTVDLSWKAGHVAVAEAGDLAGPRGWLRASGTVKDKRTLVERGSESMDVSWHARRFVHFYV